MYKHGGDIYNHPNFIDFSANINLLGAPASVIERAKSAMDEITHYPQVGCERLRQAISRSEQVKSEQIICGNGAAEVIFSLVLAQKPKKALLFVPTFQEYEQALKSVDCEIVYEYLQQENGFRMTRHCLEQIDDSIDMVFFCNPNNPTGVLTEREWLVKLLEACRQTGTLLVVDECFLDFVVTDPHTMKPFLEGVPNLFIVKAFTKIFGIPGLRLGYGLCGNNAILEKMTQVTQPWNVSVPAQEAGIAATKEKGFLARTRQAVEEEKAFLLEKLSSFEVKEQEEDYAETEKTTSVDQQNMFFMKVYGHAANYIFFQSIKGLDRKLEKYGILIRNCSNFRGLGEGWYRIAVRTREENEKLIECLEKIKKGKRSNGFAMLLKTERLIIRHITEDDWKSIKEIWEDFNESEFARYDMPHNTDDEDVRARISKWAKANSGLEHMFFAICLNSTVIGYIAFNIREDCYEIGYCFHSGYHGKGYAKESHLALFDYLRGFGITRFTAGTAINNTPSVSLLKALGFKQVETENVSFYKDSEGNDIIFEGGIFELTTAG